MRRLRHLAALMSAAVVVTAGTAFAQNARAEVSGGWRHLYIQAIEGEDGLHLPKGWYADVAVHMNDIVSIVGDVGGNYVTEDATETLYGITITGSAGVSLHTYLGGVRFRMSRNPRIVPFAQVLFGGVRASASIEATLTVDGESLPIDESESASNGGMTAGGGVNLAAGPVGVRLQAEYLKVFVDDGGNAFRFAVGVVVPF